MEADPLAIVEIVGMAGQAALWSEDWDAASRILSRVLGAARDASAVSALIHPLSAQAHLDLRRGRWAAALAGASEAAELAEDTGQLALLPHALAALTLVEAGLGHETDCRRHVERGLELAAVTRTASTCTPHSGCSSSGWAGSRRRSRRSRPASGGCCAAACARPSCRSGPT